jgi:hypothetical protein
MKTWRTRHTTAVTKTQGLIVGKEVLSAQTLERLTTARKYIGLSEEAEKKGLAGAAYYTAIRSSMWSTTVERFAALQVLLGPWAGTSDNLKTASYAALPSELRGLLRAGALSILSRLSLIERDTTELAQSKPRSLDSAISLIHALSELTQAAAYGHAAQERFGTLRRTDPKAIPPARRASFLDFVDKSVRFAAIGMTKPNCGRVRKRPQAAKTTQGSRPRVPSG